MSSSDITASHMRRQGATAFRLDSRWVGALPLVHAVVRQFAIEPLPTVTTRCQARCVLPPDPAQGKVSAATQTRIIEPGIDLAREQQVFRYFTGSTNSRRPVALGV